MRVLLYNGKRKIGYLDFEVLNYPGMMGEFRMVHAVPTFFAQEIERYIKTNPNGITTRGGHRPKDLSRYWDGIYGVLLHVAEMYPGFRFYVPPDENPLNSPDTEEMKDRVY